MSKPAPKTTEPQEIEPPAGFGLPSREDHFNAGMQQRIVLDLGAARLASIEASVQYDLVQQDLARKTAECQATAEQLAAAREEIRVLKGI